MFVPENQRIWLYTQPTDMRKSFNGLMALTTQALKEDPFNGTAGIEPASESL